MPEETIGQQLAPAGRFFEGVGTSWLSGAGEPQSIGTYILPQETPFVERILQNVREGWNGEMILDLWGPLYFMAIFFVLGFGAAITYCILRILQIRRSERIAFRAAARSVAAHDVSRVAFRWQKIQEQLESGESKRWRNAILEADQVLNDLLDSLGYKGETMAEKMKKADVAAFNTIDFAWEAHQIRNRVAKDVDFALDDKEARRVIRMYERVFREFRYIE